MLLLCLDRVLKWNFRRVHISSVTLEHLNGAYKVEDGDGDIRDPYLKQHLVKTYFVINPKVSTRESAISLWRLWLKVKRGSYWHGKYFVVKKQWNSLLVFAAKVTWNAYVFRNSEFRFLLKKQLKWIARVCAKNKVRITRPCVFFDVNQCIC